MVMPTMSITDNYMFCTTSTITLKKLSANLSLKPAIKPKSATEFMKLALLQISSIHDTGQTTSSPNARIPILFLKMVKRASINLLRTSATTSSDTDLTWVGFSFRGSLMGSKNLKCG